MSHDIPLFLARKIDAALYELDQIPAAGQPPPFDLQQISDQISSHFNVEVSIELGECEWKSPSEITEGLGTNRIALGIALTPLSGQAVWIMPREDIAHLTSWLMNGTSQGRTITSEILQEGFYRYLALNALDVLQQIEPLTSFTLRLDEEPDDGSETSFCMNLKLSFENRSAWGRLAIPKQLLHAWQRHFASVNNAFSLTPLAKNIEVIATLRTGGALLSAEEWKHLHVGDVLLLDRSSYDPVKRTGMASLMLGSTPLFHVSVKENKLTLLDYALFYEETMNHHDAEPQDMEAEELIPPEEGVSLAVQQLPLFVTIELARIKMTVDRIMKLSPGHLLELPIQPDQGVTLMVHGQKVGRGELVHLGEALGVRILEMAK